MDDTVFEVHNDWKLFNWVYFLWEEKYNKQRCAPEQYFYLYFLYYNKISWLLKLEWDKKMEKIKDNRKELIKMR